MTAVCPCGWYVSAVVCTKEMGIRRPGIYLNHDFNTTLEKWNKHSSEYQPFVPYSTWLLTAPAYATMS